MDTQFNRTAIYISLGIAIAMVFAVIFGAKYVFTSAAQQPVALPPTPSEAADSPECAAVVDALPDKLMGYSRVELADPAPAGAAAWTKSSEDKITLRCGVDLPQQFTEYSQTIEADGESWLQVVDATPGSNLTTWYSTEYTPAIAVTTSSENAKDEAPEGLEDAFKHLDSKPQKANAAPLSQLKAGPDSMCPALEKALPETLAEGYTRRTDVGDKNTWVYSAPGQEEIVVRCGVGAPENYRAGVQLQQVNDVPWFEDTTLAEGTTAGTWFALGRAEDLALSTPQEAANSALVRLSDALVKATPSQ
ncbi:MULTISPECIES: DUF3515 domain-containing protein [unclassified Corynebacterium]|uniref:DUF3515 domain-containing protein n=1 Tax=unclassified Corynebacterium TaxID=2624378 RepID=UPI0008A26886|nr:MULTISPECIES: DUF3515 domain-containing protein [unclassified Corynebacterium]OFN76448.1 hypothetical protein HMPREF2537_10130 [Corynebacterium sp. HMSC074E01]OFP67173.1 hypothetical protein HMPREF2978_03175 [Corynebacterium sp. HMSC074C01]